MKIAIMGAGAQGCVFGGLLHKAGEEVWLVAHRISQAQVIEREGLVLSRGSVEEVVRPKVTVNPADVGTADVVLFLVKSFDTATAARESIPMIGPNTYAMTLQNGIGNVETIMNSLGMDRIIYGMTTLGGSLKGPGHVEVDAVPSAIVAVHIGEWGKKRSPTLFKICEVFNNAGIRTEVSDDVDRFVWTKLAMASGVGMVTALTHLRVGDLVGQDEGKKLLSLIVEETVAIANRRGIKLDAQEMMRNIVHASQETRDHVTSMLMAFLTKKKTEIGSLNETIVKEAEQLGLSAPANQVVALLVRIIEKTYDRRVETV